MTLIDPKWTYTIPPKKVKRIAEPINRATPAFATDFTSDPGPDNRQKHG